MHLPPRLLMFIGCGLVVLGTAQCGSTARTPSPTAPSAGSPPTPVTAPRVTRVAVGVAADAEPSLAPGAALQLWAMATYDDGNRTDVTNLVQWQSSDRNVATISSSGLLTALTAGGTTISASREETGTLDVQVRQPGCEDLVLSPPAQIIDWWPSYCSSCEYFHRFRVTAPLPSCRWSVSSNAPWLDLQTEKSQRGSADVQFRLSQNERRSARVAEIVISTGQRKLAHTVTQEGAICQFELEPMERTLRRGSRSFFYVYPTPEDCTWVVKQPPGITVLDGTMRTGADRIEYIVNEDSTFWRAYMDIAELNRAGSLSAHMVEIAVK